MGLNISTHIRTILCYGFIAIWLSSCVGTRFLQEDEQVLFRQQIKGNENISSGKLENLYQQKPNARILYYLPVSPYVYMYEWGKQLYEQDEAIEEKKELINEYDNKIVREKAQGNDKKVNRLNRRLNRKLEKVEKKIENGNWLMRNGEPLVVFDSSKSTYTRDQIKLYYQSSGYFESEVSQNVKINGKRATVIFEIKEGKAHQIDSITYKSGDKRINALLRAYQHQSHLNPGDRYDQANLSKERERIEQLLKDNGYFTFNRQYIEYNVYTNKSPYLLDIEVIIKKPTDQSNHKVFTIDSVNVFTDAHINLGSQVKRQLENYREINYQYYDLAYQLKVLDRKIFINKGELYSREKQFETQRQLSNLDIFKFTQIRFDTTGSKMVANIYLSPLEKYTASNEAGVNVTQGFPGPFYNLSLKNRNTFKNLEILTLNLRAGIEGVPAVTEQDDFLSSQEVSANLALTFPRFIMPLSDNLKDRVALLNPRTTTLGGYSFTSRPEFTRSNLNGSFSYSWQNRKSTVYNFTLLEMSRITSQLNPQFDSLLTQFRQDGNQLFRAFLPSFVSSSFLNTILNFGKYGSESKRASFLRLFAEHGGTYVPLLVNNGLVDTSRLEYYQFVKFQVDYRSYRPLFEKVTIAYRANIGVGRPYGDISQNVLPYEKFFFAGGSSSVRAWAPRRLGPGSFTPITLEDGSFDYRFEQPGEILMEGSVEIRRPLFSVFNAALFVDAGNTWTFSEDNRPGGQFSSNFWREIAIGTGFGLRLDFSFLILRTDLAFKAYDPAQGLGDRWVLDRANFNLGSNYGPIINIGIGYPF